MNPEQEIIKLLISQIQTEINGKLINFIFQRDKKDINGNLIPAEYNFHLEKERNNE